MSENEQGRRPQEQRADLAAGVPHKPALAVQKQLHHTSPETLAAIEALRIRLCIKSDADYRDWGQIAQELAWVLGQQ